MMFGAHRTSTHNGLGAANFSAIGTDAKQQASKKVCWAGLGQ